MVFLEAVAVFLRKVVYVFESVDVNGSNSVVTKLMDTMTIHTHTYTRNRHASTPFLSS